MTRKADQDPIIELAQVRAERAQSAEVRAARAQAAELRADRTLAATQALLLPDESAALAAEELSRRIAAQLATLPKDECLLLRRKVLVAVHDLEGLVDALQDQMNGLAQELRKVSSHSTAATAYGRNVRRPSDHRP